MKDLKKAKNNVLSRLFYDWRQWMIKSLLDPYFIFWGRRLINRWRPRTIVVSGASGKTTLLNMLKVQLGSDRVAYSTRANTNIGVVCNLVGEAGISGSRWRWLRLLITVPWRALTRQRSESIYVVEFDIARPLAKNNIIAALKPEVCLLTNITASHSEKFDRLAQKTGQKALDLLADYQLRLVSLAHQVIYLPSRQRDYLAGFLPPTKAKVIWVESQLVEYKVTFESTLARIGQHRFWFAQPQPPKIGQQLHFLITLADYLGLPLTNDMRTMPQAPSRSTGLRGRRGSWLIDSSYNSNPASMTTILEMLSQIEAPIKWAVIGDYVELGSQSSAAHRQLAAWLAKADCDRLFLYGRRLEADTWPLIKTEADLAGKSQIYHSIKDLLADLEANLTGQEVILFKGAGFLEYLVESLLDDPTDASRLCRREPRFARQRAAFLARQTLKKDNEKTS